MPQSSTNSKCASLWYCGILFDLVGQYQKNTRKADKETQAARNQNFGNVTFSPERGSLALSDSPFWSAFLAHYEIKRSMWACDKLDLFLRIISMKQR